MDEAIGETASLKPSPGLSFPFMQHFFTQAHLVSDIMLRDRDEAWVLKSIKKPFKKLRACSINSTGVPTECSGGHGEKDIKTIPLGD